MKNKIILYALAFLPLLSWGQVNLSDLPLTPNGEVLCQKKVGNTLYLGGNFTTFSANTGALAKLNFSGTNATLGNMPLVNGSINTIAPDGSGGYFIGGTFTSVGGVSRMRLAWINASGALNPLNVGFLNTVTKIIYANGRLFVFGDFTSIYMNGTYFTKYKATEIIPSGTGSLGAWNAGISSGYVRDAIAQNGIMYVGGNVLINGAYRSLWAYNINQVNAPMVPTFNPVIAYGSSLSSAYVNTLAIGNGQLFIGGYFNKLNGITRTCVASINLSNYTNGPTNLSVSGGSSIVNSIFWSNQILYIGGTFTTINGTYRPYLCAYNTSVYSIWTNWAPNPNGPINRLGVSDGGLWVSGYFTYISLTNKSNLAVYTLSPINSFPPQLNILNQVTVNGLVNVVVNPVMGQWVIGGSFSSISTNMRANIAAIDLLTNQFTSFAPVVNGPVNSIEVIGSNVFIGGSFNLVNNNNVQNFATLNTGNGAFNGLYRASFNGTVNSLCAVGSQLYVGGAFNYVSILTGSNYQAYFKNGIIGMNLGTSSLANIATFNLTPSNNNGGATTVRCIKYLNGSLFIGGGFSLPRANLLKVTPASGTLYSFNANLLNSTSCYVKDVEFTPQGELVVGGNLGTVSGISVSTNLVYVNSTSGQLNKIAYNVLNSGYLFGPVNSIVNGNNNDIMFTNNYGIYRSSNSSGAATQLYVTGGTRYNSILKLGSLYSVGGLFSYTNTSGRTGTNWLICSPILVLPPTISSSNINFTNTTTTGMSFNWSTGNGNRRLVLMRASIPITGTPVDYNYYGASATYGYGSNISGAFVVADGTINSATVSGLQPGTMYYVKVIEYNQQGSSIIYETNGLSGNNTTLSLTPPNIGANSFSAYNISKNSMTISLNPGNGNGRIVVARAGSPVNVVPVNNQRYTASNVFGYGSHLGNGNYVVKNDLTYPFYLMGLTPGTTYYFSVFEFNEYGYAIVYNTSLVLTGNATTLPDIPEPGLPASNLSVSNIGGGSVQVSWTNGSGNNRILLACQVNPGHYNQTVMIQDGVGYPTNPNMSSFSPAPGNVDVVGPGGIIYSHRAVYVGSSNSVVLTGLNSSSYYSFIVVEFNSAGAGTQNYMQNAWANIVYNTPALVQPPNLPASNVAMLSSTGTEAVVNWVNGNGSSRIVIAKQGGPVNYTPLTNSIYAGNAAFGTGTNYNSGNYVVYNGSGSSVTVYGLTPYTDYYFSVYEYNQAYNSYTLQNETKYIVIPGNGSGKTQAPNWPRTAGGTGTDAAGGLSKDGSGNLYVAGTFNGNSYFGITPVTGASNDIFLAKYTTTGNLQWIQTAGGSAEDAASTVVTDNLGNSYVVGSFRGTARFGTSTMVTSNGSDDAFIAKYNSSGTLQWVRTMGGTDQDVAFWAAIDNAGDVVVTGYFKGSPSFSNSSQTLTSLGGSDVWVAKYSSTGNLIWSRGAGGTNYDYGHSITIGASNSVIIAGEFKQNATFGSSLITATGSESNAFIAKLNSSGAWDWATSMGGAGQDAAYGVTADSNDNYYAAGVFNGVASFGLTSLTSAGLADAFIARVNSNGSVQWATQFGGISNDNAFGVTMAANGNIFVAGGFADNITINGNTLTSSGSQDVIMISVTNNGVITQAQKYGGNMNDQARGILANNTGDAYLCGYFEGVSVFGGYEVRARGSNNNGGQQTGDMFVYNVGSVYSSNPNADIIAWYKLNGNANDASGNNFHATPVNSPVFVADRNATANSAMQFNNSYITSSITSAPQFDNISEFTYSGWIKLNSYIGGNTQTLVRSNTGLTDNLYIYLNGNGVINILLYDGSGFSISAVYSSNDYSIPLNTWTHIAFTFKTNNYIQLYLNGILQPLTGTASSSVYNSLTGFNTKTLYIGTDGYGQTSIASLDDVRFYKRALTQTEIMNMLTLNSLNSSPPVEGNGKPSLSVESPESVVFPNPNNGNFKLLLQQDHDRLLSFRITDMSGKTVYVENDQEINSGSVVKIFDLENIQNGYYLLQVIESGKVIENHKLIINP